MTEYFISKQGCYKPTPGATPSPGQLPLVSAIPSKMGKAAITRSLGGSGGKLVPAMCNTVAFGSKLFRTRTSLRQQHHQTLPLLPAELLGTGQGTPAHCTAGEMAQEHSSGSLLLLYPCTRREVHASSPRMVTERPHTLCSASDRKKEPWQIPSCWAQPWLN